MKIHFHRLLNDANRDMIKLFWVGICIFAVLPLLWVWDVYFLKRISHSIRLYRESVKEANTDALVNSPEAALHYKVEVHKYVFLLGISISEMIAMMMYLLSEDYSRIYYNHNVINNCTSGRISNFDLELLLIKPIAAVLVAIVEIALLFSHVLGICLMKYLEAKCHNIKSEPFEFIKYILLSSCLVGIFLILIPGSVPQLFLFQILYESIIQLVYFCFWIKQARTFYKTLRWRSVEYNARCSNSLRSLSIPSSLCDFILHTVAYYTASDYGY